MASTLSPIRKEDGSRLLYAERDWVGVEADDDSFKRGLNASLAFGETAHTVISAEHDPDTGLHDTLKIGTLALGLTWDSSTVPGTYLITRAYRDADVHIGADIGTVTVIGASGDGLLEVVLTDPLPWSTYYVNGMDGESRFTSPAKDVATPSFVHIEPVSVTSSTTFRVRRWIGDVNGPDVMSKSHGDIFIVIHGES